MRTAAIAALTLVLLTPAAASAGWWTYDNDGSESVIVPRVRFGSQVGLWSAEFDRPARACRDEFRQVIPRVGGELQEDIDPGFFSCANDNSTELGISAGAGVSFRLLGPLHLNAALEAIFTIPERDFALKNQLIVSLPIFLSLTFPKWVVRPILSGGLMPLLYLTDDSRDYAICSEVGLALRVGNWGDISFTASYLGAETAEGVAVRLAVSPL